MKILITGGLGFIGSHLAIFFHKQGHQVSVIDNLSRPRPNIKNPKEKPYNFHYFNKNYPQITIFLEDIRDSNKISEIFQEVSPSYVIHAAGQTSAVDSVNNPSNDFTNNVIGLFNTLEAARVCGSVKGFVYLSTNKVYGKSPNNLSLEETDTRYIQQRLDDGKGTHYGVNEQFSVDIPPHTPYGVSKLAGDLYVQEYGELYDLNTIVMRMSCIYGPRQFGFVEQGWVSHFLINAIHERPIEIYGNGKQVRYILFIDDFISFISLYMESMELQNEDPQKELAPKKGTDVFNIGGGLTFSVSLIEVIEIIETLLNRKIIVEYKSKNRTADQKYYVSDISKAKKIYNWEPRVGPKEGIMKCLEWVKHNEDLFD